MLKTILAIATGAAGSAAFFVACGNGSSGPDAAAADATPVCDCPAAEPPIAGRLVVVEQEPITMQPDSGGVTAASCPTGGVVLTGRCLLVESSGRTFLTEAGANATEEFNAWRCRWRNTGAIEAIGRAEVTCIMPAD